jgi:hypothetical protein
MGSSTSNEITGRRKSKSKQFEHYGCLSWQPAMPEGDNDELHDRMRLELLSLLETNGDPCKMKDLMKTTYSLQRRVINLGMPIAQIFEQWPLLDEPEYLFDHFRQLTGVDIASLLPATMHGKAHQIYNYFHKSNAANSCYLIKQTLLEVKAMMISTNSSKPLFYSMLFVVMAHFGEDQDNLLNFYPVSWIKFFYLRVEFSN